MKYPLLSSIIKAKYNFDNMKIKELIQSGNLIEWYNIAILKLTEERDKYV